MKIADLLLKKSIRKIPDTLYLHFFLPDSFRQVRIFTLIIPLLWQK